MFSFVYCMWSSALVTLKKKYFSCISPCSQENRLCLRNILKLSKHNDESLSLKCSISYFRVIFNRAEIKENIKCSDYVLTKGLNWVGIHQDSIFQFNWWHDFRHVGDIFVPETIHCRQYFNQVFTGGGNLSRIKPLRFRLHTLVMFEV